MQRLIGSTLVLVFAMFVFGQAIFMAAEKPELAGAAPRAIPSASKKPVSAAFLEDGTHIQRDASGQFHLDAAVNGEDTRFLVDTGADVVALTVEEGERLGLAVGPDDFRPILRTASGVGNGAPVRLGSVMVGDQELRDVDAVVVEGLSVNLLGQSVLRRLGGVELQGDRMVIRHR